MQPPSQAPKIVGIVILTISGVWTGLALYVVVLSLLPGTDMHGYGRIFGTLMAIVGLPFLVLGLTLVQLYRSRRRQWLKAETFPKGGSVSSAATACGTIAE